MEPENKMFPYVCKANPYHRKEEEYHDFRGDLMPCRKVMLFIKKVFAFINNFRNKLKVSNIFRTTYFFYQNVK